MVPHDVVDLHDLIADQHGPLWVRLVPPLYEAILANLLLGSESADEAADSYGAPVEEYGAPVQDSYGAPAPSYEEPAPAYSAPAYEAPADTYGSPDAPVVETYGAPAADPLPAYNGRY